MSEANASPMRHAFLDMLAQFVDQRPDRVLFTTFNFSPAFFEANVLPMLADPLCDNLEGGTSSQSALNEALESIGTVVVCDRSTVPEPKGSFRYGLLPVGLASGRFHPKIILMSGTLVAGGKRGLWFSVSSGNLSLTGWGRNREVVAISPVTSQHQVPLNGLLSWLLAQADQHVQWIRETADPEDCSDAASDFEEGRTREVLEALKAALNASDTVIAPENMHPTLHLAIPQSISMEGWDAREPLLDALSGKGQWDNTTVISPYWAGVHSLMASVRSKRFRLIPSIRPDGKFSFPLADVAKENPSSISFAAFADEGDRYTHAKAYLFEKGKERILCIGSANFTGAALRRGDESGEGAFENIEAMLRYELAGKDPWANLFRNLSKEEIAAPEDDDPEDCAPPLPPVMAEVLCDWKTGTFHCRVVPLSSSKLVSGISLEIAGKSPELKGVDNVLRGKLPFRGVAPVRVFTLTYLDRKGNLQSFRGLVTQLNALPDQLGYSPPPRLAQILAYLRGLDPDSHNGKKKHRAPDGEGADGDEAEVEPTFDFFTFFQATYKLRHYHEKRKEADPFAESSSHGVPMLYRAVVLQPAITPEEVIGRYVQLSELMETIEWLELRCGRGSAELLKSDVKMEMVNLKPKIWGAMQESVAFKGMFGSRGRDVHISNFLEWFEREIKESSVGRT